MSGAVSASATTFVALLLLLAGCATTEQTRSVEPSGFLGDYSRLQPGKSGQALLVYIDGTADFSRYDECEHYDPDETYFECGHYGSGKGEFVCFFYRVFGFSFGFCAFGSDFQIAHG